MKQNLWPAIALLLLPLIGLAQPPKPGLRSVEVKQYSDWQLRFGAEPAHLYTQHFDQQGRHIRTDFSPTYSSYAASIRQYSPDGRTVDQHYLDRKGQYPNRSRLIHDAQGRLIRLEFAMKDYPLRPVTSYEYRDGLLYKTLYHGSLPNDTGVASTTIHIRNRQGQLISERTASTPNSPSFPISMVKAGEETGTWVLEHYLNAEEPWMYSKETFKDRALSILLRSDYYDQQGQHIQYKGIFRDERGRIVGDTFHDFRHDLSFKSALTLDGHGDTLSLERTTYRKNAYAEGAVFEKVQHDEAGLPIARTVFGPDGKLSYTWSAQRNLVGQMLEEREATGDGALISARSYRWDEKGRLLARQEITPIHQQPFDMFGRKVTRQPEIRFDTVLYHYVHDGMDSVAAMYRQGIPPELRAIDLDVNGQYMDFCVPGSPSWKSLGHNCALEISSMDTFSIRDTTRYTFTYQSFWGQQILRHDDHVKGQQVRIREFDDKGLMVLEYDPHRWREGLLVLQRFYTSRRSGDTLERQVHIVSQGRSVMETISKYLDSSLVQRSGPGEHRYDYNQQGQLWKHTTSYGPTTTITEYSYDPEGRCIQQLDFSGSGDLGGGKVWDWLPGGRSEGRVMVLPSRTVTQYLRTFW